MYSCFCIITDRIFTYTNGLYDLPEFTAVDITIDALALTTIIAVIVLCNSPKIFWVGSLTSAKYSNGRRFISPKAPVWRPFFKKDGYFGIFTENTLWS